MRRIAQVLRVRVASVMAKSAKFLTGLTIILFGFVRMLCARGG